MEFWGVEVKAGEPLKVEPGIGFLIHLSQASLGESKKGKGNETVPLSVKCGNQKVVLGTLSSENFPQLSFDLVFEKEFELSHNWKNGSVYFCGYKAVLPDSDDELSDYPSSEEDVKLPVKATENGKPETKAAEAKPASGKTNVAKPESSAKPKVKLVEPIKDNKVKNENEDEDSDEDDVDDSEDDDSDEEGSEDAMDEDDSDDDEDEDDSEDEETPKKPELGKKRSTESATKTPVPAKKAKLATPQKTDGKKGGHTATPYPSKQAGKNVGISDKSSAQTPKSGGQFSCKSCTKTFGSDVGLQSHTKAKHSGGK